MTNSGQWNSGFPLPEWSPVVEQWSGVADLNADGADCKLTQWWTCRAVPSPAARSSTASAIGSSSYPHLSPADSSVSATVRINGSGGSDGDSVTHLNNPFE